MILGVCGGPRGSHEPGITLIKNGKIIFASQEERFSRNKNGISSYPHYAIKEYAKKNEDKPKKYSYCRSSRHYL